MAHEFTEQTIVDTAPTTAMFSFEHPVCAKERVSSGVKWALGEAKRNAPRPERNVRMWARSRAVTAGLSAASGLGVHRRQHALSKLMWSVPGLGKYNY